MAEDLHGQRRLLAVGCRLSYVVCHAQSAMGTEGTLFPVTRGPSFWCRRFRQRKRGRATRPPWQTRVRRRTSMQVFWRLPARCVSTYTYSNCGHACIAHRVMIGGDGGCLQATRAKDSQITDATLKSGTGTGTGTRRVRVHLAGRNHLALRSGNHRPTCAGEQAGNNAQRRW